MLLLLLLLVVVLLLLLLLVVIDIVATLSAPLLLQTQKNTQKITHSPQQQHLG